MGVSAAAGIFLLVLDVPQNLDDMIGDMMGFRASGRQLVRLRLCRRGETFAQEKHMGFIFSGLPRPATMLPITAAVEEEADEEEIIRGTGTGCNLRRCKQAAWQLARARQTQALHMCQA